jgi:hypothetical protein
VSPLIAPRLEGYRTFPDAATHAETVANLDSPRARCATIRALADTITTVALAELCGVTRRTVSDLARRGIMVRSGRNYAHPQW